MKEQGNRGGIGKQGLRPTGKNRRKRGYQVTTNTKKPLHRDPATKTCFDPFEFTRTYTHKHKQTHTHTSTHARTHAQSHARSIAYTGTRAHSHIHTNTHTHTCSKKLTQGIVPHKKKKLIHRSFSTKTSSRTDTSTLKSSHTEATLHTEVSTARSSL